MMLFALDCDGTMDVSSGPVPVASVRVLISGHRAFIIGNPNLKAYLDLPADQEGGKSATLQRWKERHPGMDRYIVVDDTPAQYQAGWEGWEFFSPTGFIEEFL